MFCLPHKIGVFMKKRRISFIVDKSFQYTIVLGIVIICFIGFIIEISLLNYFIYHKVNSIMWQAHIDIKTTGEIITPIVVYTLLGTLVITLATLLIYMKIITKKISTTIHRLHREIQSAANGDLSVNIHLRKEDHFKEVAAQLNDMVTSTRNKFKKTIDYIKQVDKLIDIMQYTTDKPEVFSKKYIELIFLLKHLSKINEGKK